MSRTAETTAAFAGSGALAGVLSTLGFTLLHQFMIGPIWFALAAMLMAGALCGACLAWSYALVVPEPTVPGWLRYNALYLGLFVALGLTSLAAFEPVTTIGALLQAKQPPRELIARALPVTGLFTVAAAGLLALLYRPGWRRAAVLLLTMAVLVLFLGLNISTLGLVEIPGAQLGVLGEVLVLLIAILGLFAAAVVALDWSRLSDPSQPNKRFLH